MVDWVGLPHTPWSRGRHVAALGEGAWAERRSRVWLGSVVQVWRRGAQRTLIFAMRAAWGGRWLAAPWLGVPAAARLCLPASLAFHCSNPDAGTVLSAAPHISSTSPGHFPNATRRNDIQRCERNAHRGGSTGIVPGLSAHVGSFGGWRIWSGAAQHRFGGGAAHRLESAPPVVPISKTQ